MRLGNPVKDFKCSLYPQGDVTQWYGENKALYSKVCPSPGVCMTGGHNGIDIVRPWGEPIYCVDGGIVVEALGKETGYGTHVKVYSDSGFEYTYGHLSAIDKDCNLGERIERGQLIGKMGNTGFVVSGQTPFWNFNPYAGTHLHLGMRKVTLWNGTGQWSASYLNHTANPIRVVVENYNNGTFGHLPITAAMFDVPEEVRPLHIFTRDLEFGMQNDPDVKQLQDILKFEGLMPHTIDSTGNYFEQTRRAVLAYQKKYKLITWAQEIRFRGRFVAAITRAHLNKSYGG